MDTILNTELLSSDELNGRLSINSNEPFLLVVQHPVTTEVEQAPKRFAYDNKRGNISVNQRKSAAE